MSVSGISSNNLFSYYNTQDVQSKMKQFQQEFQQLGQDLQSGNLSAAQQAYSTIQQDVQQASPHMHHHHHHLSTGTSDTTSSSNNPLAQEFSTLGQALQSGNLSAAQTAYSTMQQDLMQLGWTSASTPQTANNTVSVTA